MSDTNHMRSKTGDKILNRIKSRKTPYVLHLLNTEITVLKNVYPPENESVFLAEQLTNQEYGVKRGEYVLDYGCGTGFLGIVAAKLGARVIAIDINKRAVQNTKLNAKNNNVDKNIDIREGNSFEEIKEIEKFDLILASLPFEQAPAESMLEYAVYDPKLQMRQELFRNAQKLLTIKGRILFNYSERAQKIKPIQESNDNFKYEMIARKIIDNEPYMIFLIQSKTVC